VPYPVADWLTAAGHTWPSPSQRAASAADIITASPVAESAEQQKKNYLQYIDEFRDISHL